DIVLSATPTLVRSTLPLHDALPILSALHPRYARAQRERVMGELLPRLKRLAQLAAQYGIGLNIDAEEADRLELSLDLLEALAFEDRKSTRLNSSHVKNSYAVFCLKK